MTKIAFDAAYDMETLQKKSAVELREIWMKVCAPPALKKHMIGDIIYFQKKHKSAILRMQHRCSTGELDFRKNHRETRMQLRNIGSVPVERKSKRHPEIRRRTQLSTTRHSGSRVRSKSQERHHDNEHRPSRQSAVKHQSFSTTHSDTEEDHSISGFLKWITSNSKVDKKSGEDKGSLYEKNSKEVLSTWYKEKGSLK